jgi:hypothetical protein
VLRQAGAPLSRTSERADTLFVCEGVRKAAANERQPQRAERAMYTERADTLLVGERRRSRPLPSAIRARDVRAADLQSKPRKRCGTRAVLRHSRFVGSDEDGGFPANIAASAASH